MTHDSFVTGNNTTFATYPSSIQDGQRVASNLSYASFSANVPLHTLEFHLQMRCANESSKNDVDESFENDFFANESFENDLNTKGSFFSL